MLSPGKDLATQAHNWQFVELWIDPIVFPPQILLLVGDQHGYCSIYNPASNYGNVFSSSSYEEAHDWLLEDEYERFERRLMAPTHEP
jgi:hypothetical protein